MTGVKIAGYNLGANLPVFQETTKSHDAGNIFTNGVKKLLTTSVGMSQPSEIMKCVMTSSIPTKAGGITGYIRPLPKKQLTDGTYYITHIPHTSASLYVVRPDDTVVTLSGNLESNMRGLMSATSYYSFNSDPSNTFAPRFDSSGVSKVLMVRPSIIFLHDPNAKPTSSKKSSSSSSSEAVSIIKKKKQPASSSSSEAVTIKKKKQPASSSSSSSSSSAASQLQEKKKKPPASSSSSSSSASAASPPKAKKKKQLPPPIVLSDTEDEDEDDFEVGGYGRSHPIDLDDPRVLASLTEKQQLEMALSASLEDDKKKRAGDIVDPGVEHYVDGGQIGALYDKNSCYLDSFLFVMFRRPIEPFEDMVMNYQPRREDQHENIIPVVTALKKYVKAMRTSQGTHSVALRKVIRAHPLPNPNPTQYEYDKAMLSTAGGDPYDVLAYLSNYLELTDLKNVSHIIRREYHRKDHTDGSDCWDVMDRDEETIRDAMTIPRVNLEKNNIFEYIAWENKTDVMPEVFDRVHGIETHNLIDNSHLFISLISGKKIKIPQTFREPGGATLILYGVIIHVNGNHYVSAIRQNKHDPNLWYLYDNLGHKQNHDTKKRYVVKKNVRWDTINTELKYSADRYARVLLYVDPQSVQW